MDLARVDLTDEQERFKKEVREFVETVITPDVLDHERRTGEGFNEKVHLDMGRRGWIMPSWSRDQGGAELDGVCQRILQLELEQADVPLVTTSTTRLVVGSVAKHAPRDVAADLLPKVAAGHVRFCLGYTEPDGGSDIAAAKTRAVRDGDEWVIDGSKMFTTGAQNCQYVYLITRTDPDLPKHKGLTMFLVPLDSPGVEIQAIRTYGGERTNIVYYDDVRVPDRYRLGGVNAGWSVLHGPLDDEHGIGRANSGLTDPAGATFARLLARAVRAAAAWAAQPGPDGRRRADDPAFVRRLGALAVQAEAALATSGAASRVKGSEALIRGAAELIDLIGPEALLARGQSGAAADGLFDEVHRFAQGTATYGGTVEVFRTIIAQHELGLPRPDYPGRKVLVSAKGARRPAA